MGFDGINEIIVLMSINLKLFGEGGIGYEGDRFSF